VHEETAYVGRCRAGERVAGLRLNALDIGIADPPHRLVGVREQLQEPAQTLLLTVSHER
jgi:hypothetical protein